MSKFFSHICSAIFALSFIIFANLAYGQHRVDPSTLSFGENIEQPKSSSKGINDLRTHIQAVEAAFKRGGLETRLTRNGEVAVIILPCSLLFAPNSATLLEEGNNVLLSFGDFLKYPTMYKMLVAVYSDNTGERAYSEDLTSRRANAIDLFLNSIHPDIKANTVPFGMGQDDPVKTNNSMEGRNANRRVEIYIVPEWQMIDMAKSGKLKQK